MWWFRILNRWSAKTDDPRLERWAGPHDQDTANVLSGEGHLMWLEGAGWRHDPRNCPRCGTHHLLSVDQRFLAALRFARRWRDNESHPWD